METEFVRRNSLAFPDLKFSEDTIFYMEVLLRAGTISTSSEVVYYANRLGENSASLTTQTSLAEKMEAKELALHYVLGRGLDVALERQVLSRFYDLDFVTRVLKRRRYLSSSNKSEYHEIMAPLFSAEALLRYPVRELFASELNYHLYEICRRQDYELLASLLLWHLDLPHERYFDPLQGRFYEVTPKGVADLPVDLVAALTSVSAQGDRVCITVSALGDFVSIEGLRLTNRRRSAVEFVIPLFKRDGNGLVFVASLKEIEVAVGGDASIALVFDDFKRVSVEGHIDGVGSFYTTVNDRLGYRHRP